MEPVFVVPLRKEPSSFSVKVDTEGAISKWAMRHGLAPDHRVMAVGVHGEITRFSATLWEQGAMATAVGDSIGDAMLYAQIAIRKRLRRKRRAARSESHEEVLRGKRAPGSEMTCSQYARGKTSGCGKTSRIGRILGPARARVPACRRAASTDLLQEVEACLTIVR